VFSLRSYVAVSIGLVWESAKSGSQHIRDVVNCIGTTLNLEEVGNPYQTGLHPITLTSQDGLV